MFVEHVERPQGEPVKEKVSDLIRRGLANPNFIEYKYGYLSSYYDGMMRGCALGAAWIGSGRSYKEYRRGDITLGSCLFIANTLGISEELAGDISYRHYLGESALSISNWLESQGY